MIFQAKTTSFLTQRSDCLVVPVRTAGKLDGAAAELDKACSGLLKGLLSDGDLGDKLGSTLFIRNPAGLAAKRLLLVSAGKNSADLSADQFSTLLTKVASAVTQTKAKDVALCLQELQVTDRDEAWKAQQVAKLLSDACYRFNQLKSEKGPAVSLKKALYLLADKNPTVAAINKAMATGAAIAAGMALAKDLGNLPGNVCTPRYLTSEAKKLARGQAKMTAKALNEKQMRELGMGSLLSVSAGSDEEAQLIVMEYNGGKKTDKPVVLVGKGITFDTGGISLKPGAAMDEMKYDMCGAASVLGVMKTVLELGLPINLVGIVAAAENMPSGRATKPGDIVTSMSGQTIEVLNTDAEGRLVLCDALTYAERFKPKAVIDIATLTGAVVVALGKHASGLFSSNDSLAQQLLDAGQETGDKAWRMPLWEDYQELLDSNFADMANIGGPTAGSITAACFLSRYTKAYDWAHLDIAGTAWVSGSAKGATGRPVPLLVQYLMKQL
ncbi:leucyl aminopeptidase [Pseudomaricurvus alcaniphilus]|uniref:leucyl aminopeptidase n=1 Tax=Pseudomaricurvus alcaniphilus TaxID=1166482 RepID=UPI00140CA7AA|nr:leucyl aminopeptidase [Pseudomaricurvus alcaniphilus]NHN39623.1 leucyl aminopeptidase [Pseudomaricurvus alcaniphilus]